nr:unnamed protein product [Meloidogyne enterolobii]
MLFRQRGKLVRQRGDVVLSTEMLFRQRGVLFYQRGMLFQVISKWMNLFRELEQYINSKFKFPL